MSEDSEGVLTRESFDAFVEKWKQFQYKPDEHPEDWIYVGMKDVERFPALLMIEREDWGERKGELGCQP